MSITSILLGFIVWWAAGAAVAALVASRNGLAINRELLLRGPLGAFAVIKEAASSDALRPAAEPSATASLPVGLPEPPLPVDLPEPPLSEPAGPEPVTPGRNIFESIDARQERPSLPVVSTPEPDVQMAVLDGRFELEAFDRLPQRPRAGWVKTVCPTCRKKTRHDREATCRKCKQVNSWLAERWQVDQTNQAASMPALGSIAPHESLGSGMVRCPSCSRRAVPDLHGRCAFCGQEMGVSL